MLSFVQLDKPHIDIELYGTDTNISPIDKVHIMDEDSFEQFTLEWLFGCKKSKYSSIKRIGGAGDKGRDVVGYYSDGTVDYYQCKHYNTGLAPTNYYLELGKLCYYTYKKEISIPKEYFIIASNDVGSSLQDLIDKPSDLLTSLIKNWDTVPIWQMDERYEQAVMERLSDRFGDVESTDIASALMETAKNVVEDNLQDYFSQLKDCTKDSFLEELDDFNIEVIYRRLAANSVAFMLISRCGLDANEFFDRDVFADIVNFNTPATINAIGIATSDIAEMALREISQSIRNVQIVEKDQNRTFAQRTQAQYDKGRLQPERSEYNERNHLQQTGGVSYSRPNITDRARASAWQVRFDAQGLSGEAQTSDLSQPADIGQAERASARGRADSTPEVGVSDEAALSRSGRDRGTERESSDAVGRIDEQHPQPSGGSDTDRTDLQVSVAKDDEVRVNLPTLNVGIK